VLTLEIHEPSHEIKINPIEWKKKQREILNKKWQEMKFEKRNAIKKIKKKTIIKNRDQIWCKNKLKSNNKEWNWKQNSNRKGFKKIKRIKIKYKNQIRSNDQDKVEGKIN